MDRLMNIDSTLSEFVARLQSLYNDYYKTRYDNLSPPIIEVAYGKRYAKIVACDTYGSCQKSVYCFVDRSNGDILKAATWKAPAKGKRGSIFNEDCDVGHNKPANVHGYGLYK